MEQEREICKCSDHLHRADSLNRFHELPNVFMIFLVHTYQSYFLLSVGTSCFVSGHAKYCPGIAQFYLFEVGISVDQSTILNRKNKNIFTEKAMGNDLTD